MRNWMFTTTTTHVKTVIVTVSPLSKLCVPVADLPWREVVQLRQGAGPEGGAWNPDFFKITTYFSGFDLGFAAVDMRVDV